MWMLDSGVPESHIICCIINSYGGDENVAIAMIDSCRGEMSRYDFALIVADWNLSLGKPR